MMTTTPKTITLMELRICQNRKKNYLSHLIYPVDQLLSTDTHLVYQEWLKPTKTLLEREHLDTMEVVQAENDLILRMFKGSHPEEKDAEQVLGVFEDVYRQILKQGGLEGRDLEEVVSLEFLTIVKLPVEHHGDQGPEKRLILPGMM